MISKVVLSDSAIKDVDNILDYLTHKLLASEAGKAFIEKIEHHITLLETNPYMYELSKNERLNLNGYRRFIIGKYIILYTISDDHCLVTIARVVYGSRDYTNWI